MLCIVGAAASYKTLFAHKNEEQCGFHHNTDNFPKSARGLSKWCDCQLFDAGHTSKSFSTALHNAPILPAPKPARVCRLWITSKKSVCSLKTGRVKACMMNLKRSSTLNWTKSCGNFTFGNKAGLIFSLCGCLITYITTQWEKQKQACLSRYVQCIRLSCQVITKFECVLSRAQVCGCISARPGLPQQKSKR